MPEHQLSCATAEQHLEAYGIDPEFAADFTDDEMDLDNSVTETRKTVNLSMTNGQFSPLCPVSFVVALVLIGGGRIDGSKIEARISDGPLPGSSPCAIISESFLAT